MKRRASALTGADRDAIIAATGYVPDAAAPPAGVTTFTIQECAELLGVNWHTAKRQIKKGISKNKIATGRERRPGRGIFTVYWVVGRGSGE